MAPIDAPELDVTAHGFVATRLWTPEQRSFVDIEVRGDGRTLYGLAVPFDEEATVNDGRGRYQEVFRMGSFAKTIQENRVKLMAAHDTGRFPIGKPTMLREDAAGLVGEFRVSATRDGDEALQLVKDGVLDAFSVGFSPVRQRRTESGTVERIEVRLHEVSVVAFPAYAGATIAGVRHDILDNDTPESLDVDFQGSGAVTPVVAGAPELHPPGPTQAERRQRVAAIRGVTV